MSLVWRMARIRQRVDTNEHCPNVTGLTYTEGHVDSRNRTAPRPRLADSLDCLRGAIHGGVGRLCRQRRLAPHGPRPRTQPEQVTVDHQRLRADVRGLLATGWTSGGPFWP